MCGHMKIIPFKQFADLNIGQILYHFMQIHYQHNVRVVAKLYSESPVSLFLCLTWKTKLVISRSSNHQSAGITRPRYISNYTVNLKYTPLPQYFQIKRIQENISCHLWLDVSQPLDIDYCPNGPDAGRGAGIGSEFFHFEKKVNLKVLPCCIKFHEPHVVL